MSKALHIAILGTRGIPNQYGGFEQCAQYLGRSLVKLGHRVTVYNSSLHNYKDAEWNGVEIAVQRDRENLLGTTGQFIYDWNCIAHARRQSYDVVIQMGYTSSSLWFWRWQRQSAHVVNMDGLEHQRIKYSRSVRAFLKLAERLATLRADALVADNPGIETYLRHLYRNKIRMISYGAEVPVEFNPHLLAPLGLQPGHYAVVIARIEPENHLLEICEACEATGTTLVVVGNNATPLGIKLVRRAYRHVRFAGSVYNAEVLNALRHYAGRYIHGHSVGGTNPSLLEAMACGAYIIAHDNVFNRSVTGSSARYFANPNELSRLLSEPVDTTEALTWKELNMDKIRNAHRWEDIARQYEALCYEVAPH